MACLPQAVLCIPMTILQPPTGTPQSVHLFHPPPHLATISLGSARASVSVQRAHWLGSLHSTCKWKHMASASAGLLHSAQSPLGSSGCRWRDSSSLGLSSVHCRYQHALPPQPILHGGHAGGRHSSTAVCNAATHLGTRPAFRVRASGFSDKQPGVESLGRLCLRGQPLF